MSAWSDDQRRDGRRLWRCGLSAAEVGAEIGKSRMAVIGMADRDGWGLHPSIRTSPIVSNRGRAPTTPATQQEEPCPCLAP